MTSTFQSLSRLFVLAVFTTTGIVGCGDAGDSTDGQPGTTAPDTVAPSQPGSLSQPGSKSNAATEPKPDSSETVRPPETVSPPDISLTDAAVTGNVEAVRKHIAAGTDLNQRNSEGGATALIAAASFGQNETAILLIEGGADLEVKDNGGSTALHTAAFLCHGEIVKALLAKGSDRNARTNAGSTALESVAGPFDEVKPIYDLLVAILGPYGLELDYEFLKETRPKIAEILRAE